MLSVPAAAVGVSVTVQVELVEPVVSVHGLVVKPPVPLVANETVPVGADLVPGSVSLTVAVQLLVPFSGTEAGEHVTAVEVDRFVTARANGPAVLSLVWWLPSPA